MDAKTIRILLTEGTPNGLMIAEIIGRAEIVLVFSRSQFPKVANRDEVKKTGLYILVGQDFDEITKECVYIGEADNIWTRLKQHTDDTDKEFWNRTIIIVGKDENLTKAHVRYLESSVISLAKQASRAVIANKNYPPLPTLPESDRYDMASILEQVQILLPVLGFSFYKRYPLRTFSGISRRSVLL